jgi:3-oxoacyl-[acyl-carrier protein] reductase
MDLSLTGKIAVVGGASQGIGYAIAHLLASEGASVAMVARKEEPLNEACARIAAETGAKTFAIPADIRKGADCERIISQALDEFERIDILINNDGAPPFHLELAPRSWTTRWQARPGFPEQMCQKGFPSSEFRHS